MKHWIAGLLFANVAVYAYLHLVAEPPVPPASASRPSALRVAGEPALPAPNAPPACRSIGPLHDADVAQLVADWLKGVNRSATRRSLEVAAPSSYWVITTRKNSTLATHLVQQLRAAGVADVEVVPPDTPNGETRVSLGVYADRAHAERRILDLKGYALSTTIVEQPRRVMQWWLDVNREADGTLVDLAALVRAVPTAAGATFAPCVLSMPPADATPDSTPDPKPQPAAAAKPRGNA